MIYLYLFLSFNLASGVAGEIRFSKQRLCCCVLLKKKNAIDLAKVPVYSIK